MRVRIPPVIWMSVSSEWCVLSDGDLCIGLITRPESRTECGVSECDLEASIIRKLWPTRGCYAIKNNPSKREATDPPVQQRSHWVRLLLYCAYGISRGYFRLLWSCIVNVGWRERTQQDANNRLFIIKLLSQHVSGIIMPIIRRTRLCSTSVHGLALLMMGIVMPETCWDRSLILNIRLFACCWFLSVHPNWGKVYICRLTQRE